MESREGSQSQQGRHRAGTRSVAVALAKITSADTQNQLSALPFLQNGTGQIADMGKSKAAAQKTSLRGKSSSEFISWQTGERHRYSLNRAGKGIHDPYAAWERQASPLFIYNFDFAEADSTRNRLQRFLLTILMDTIHDVLPLRFPCGSWSVCIPCFALAAEPYNACKAQAE